ncbi:serine/threonine-protein kinase [Kutzneria albida]|uniref:non-specific serine/threonine protein kinase n=1 Tax=Kutzneria albida DSM 43870 TaxID=1449976 RepID=W5WLP5_9PSEU|nr:serine/threonine-protein kinase [Kutzneria albida]AHI01492.1 hypothetical protein KALB_8134 [Kutzneria albida DSM 43870]
MSDDGRLIAGRYRLTSRIGSGAMGVVWTARDERLHRVVAVKQLLLSNTMSAAESHEAKQRAMREGRIAARLQHPHAIAVYDVAEEDGNPWLIMEYLPSKSLSAVLAERGTLPPHEAARIASQAASALDAAHAAGIVHRDIKPGNILLGDDGVVKITDFGISRATGDVTVTATGMLAGTPAYLAPEVAKGYDPGPPSDVFSLGSTIYASVEGEPPFGLNENTLALLHAVAAGQVNPPRQAGPLHPLLMRLLSPEPTERPTMGQAREALAAVAAGRPIPPALLGPAAAPTWRVSPPTAATRPISPPTPPRPMAPPPMAQGPAPTRMDARPFSSPGGTRVGSGPVGSGPHTRPPSTRPPEPPKPKSHKPMVLAGLAVVAAAAVGILLASMLTPNGSKANGESSPPSSTSTSPSVEQTTAAPNKPPKTTAAPTTTTTTEPTTTTAEAPSSEDLEQAVSSYYGLLPQGTDQAFAMLTPKMQSSSGGAAGYKAFWSSVTSVKASKVKATSKNKVTTTVTYVKGGKTSAERVTLTLVNKDGQLLIDSSTAQQLPGGGDPGDS